MKKIKIGFVTFPIGEANVVPLLNIIDICLEITNDIYIITGNSGQKINRKLSEEHFKILNHISGSNIIARIFNYIKTQIKVTIAMLTFSNKVDIWIFPIGGNSLLLSALTLKIQRKPYLFLLTSSSHLMFQYQKDRLNHIPVFFERLCSLLSKNIILYSPNLIEEWNLAPYRHKILIAHHHFLDFTKFTIITPYSDRPPLIGYIGRLSAEKGVQHFAEALSAILSKHQDLRVLIGGDGSLKDAIEASLQEEGIADHVNLPGWISHDDLPKYLNQLRLLVLPSYTEGLPNIMLEAMACGTPVLATPVGAIPDVIQDEVTGFIMENNTPECIAQNVMRALNHPDLEGIAERGRQYVAREFTFEKAVERWRRILEECEQ